MYCSSLCASTILLACYFVSASIEVYGVDVPATDAAISRFMADAPKHEVETAEEHREKELAAFLKTGKMPGAPPVPKKDSSSKVAIDKTKEVPTEVLMKQFIEGGSHIKKHSDAAGRGRGPDKTSSPTVAGTSGKGNEKVPAPSKSPKVKSSSPTVTATPTKAPKAGKDKKQKGKKKSDTFTKAPKPGKKDSKKKKKKDEKDLPSDVPSSSPSPTFLGHGDVSLPPDSTYVEHEEDGNNNGNDSDGHQDNGRSTDGNDGSNPNSNAETDDSSPSNSSPIAKIVSPLAAFAGLILIAGVWISRRRSLANEPDEDDNLMKHTREGFDVETGTVSGNTYRTGAFTEDDGTLEESVDVAEENRKSNISRTHAKEMVQVLSELEEVSINDDGASTTSVSSGSHSATNSCDGSLIEAARAAMSADAFLPDKSKVYDSSVKPEWATRTSSTAADEFVNEGDDATSVGTTSYKKFLTSSPSPDVNNAELEEGKEINDVDVALSNSSEIKIPVAEEGPIDDKTSTPAWMKTQLRPVSANTSTPNSEVFNEQTSGVGNEPEWMKKFKQMGLEKKE